MIPGYLVWPSTGGTAREASWKCLIAHVQPLSTALLSGDKGVHLFAHWPVQVLDLGCHAIRNGQGAHLGVKARQTQALPLCHKPVDFLSAPGF